MVKKKLSGVIDIKLEPIPGREICDFCAYPQRFKVFAAYEFDYVRLDIIHRRDHGWAGCRECARLVDQEQWNALTDRAVKRFVWANRVPPEDQP